MEREASRFCTSPALGHLQGEKAGRQVGLALLVPGLQPFQLPPGAPQGSQCPMLCFLEGRPREVPPPHLQYYPPPPPSLLLSSVTW